MKIKKPQYLEPPKARPQVELTEVARTDAALLEGRTDSVLLGPDAQRIELSEQYKREAFGDFAFKTTTYGFLGVVGGLALTEFNPMGAAVGAGLATYMAWNKSLRANTGKVEVHLDGEKQRDVRYHGDPRVYPKSAAQIRTEMLVDGRLGERIAPFSPSPSALEAKPDAALKEELKSLGASRKLVADLGQKSRYGYPVLHSVDALSAAKLIAGGTEVYALGGKSHDKKTELFVSAANQRSTIRHGTSESYITRSFDYQLKAIKDRESLQDLPSGEGLPVGLHGVYKNQESCSITIGSDEQHGFGKSEGQRSHDQFKSRRQLRDPNLDLGRADKAKVVTRSSINVRDVITMAGICVGMATAQALFPSPTNTLIGGVVGGVIGREAGWLAQDRMPSLPRRMDSLPPSMRS